MKIVLLIAGLLGGVWCARGYLPGVGNVGAQSECAVSYYGNGAKKSSIEYHDGRRTGTCEEWYPDGRTECRGELVDGVKQGPWSFWRADGSLDEVRSGNYLDGRKLGD
jgi:antitoxin component YwqK of YwqJK toxin-antitoxin module